MRSLSLAVVAAAAASVSAQGPEDAVIRPGQPWFDTSGNRIYAGGANMYKEGDTYYLIGEGKKVLGADCSECFNLYKTTDLQNWDFVGCALKNENIVAPPPYNNEAFYRMERPKIFKCPSNGKYMMWFHCDTSGFDMRSVGVLSADSVEGPYTFVAPCFKPDGQDSYDMGTYYDDPAMPGGDGHVYLIRSVRNQFAGISRMTDDCTNTTGITSQGPDMEGQAIMRDWNGTLHAAGSHLTGWSANAAQFVTSPNSSLMNAIWVDNINPSNDPTTYNSQSTFLFPFKHADGHTTFIWMADRWNANGPGGLDNMTFIWLPLLPPTGGNPVPAPGWNLQLDTCDATNTQQQFSPQANGLVKHSSGLCVSQPGSENPNGPLVLAICNTSDSNQMWYPTPGRTVSSTQSGSGANCVNWNNANQVLPVGNPVIAWGCSTPPAWNAAWVSPSIGSTGTYQAYGHDGSPSGMCVTVAPAQDPSQWSLPWFDAWSLKNF